MSEIKDLIGKVLTEVKNNNDELIFVCDNGKQYKMLHQQDCCESVSIDDINGDLQDLVGSPIILAEEASNEVLKFKSDGWYSKKDNEGNYDSESCTWTFYKLATIKGYVDIRWFGESNGYYSESVDFIEVGVDREW